MKKIIITISLLIYLPLYIMAVQVWDGSSTSWTSGSGTEESPYLIEIPAHLAYLSARVAAGQSYSGVFFKQTNDFDMKGTSYSFPPIGMSSTRPFSGIYDGDSHYIENLKPSAYNSSCALFGWAISATIQNVTVNSISYISTSATANGGGTIYNYEYDKVAAIVGYIENGRVINCINNASADANKAIKVAGIAAEAQSTTIIRCENNALITHFQGSFGTTEDYYWGGIVAYCTSQITIENCINSNGIVAEKYSGGIIAYISNDTQTSEIRNCENRGGYALSKILGGIIGYTDAKTIIENCKNTEKLHVNFAAAYPSDETIIMQAVGGICGRNLKELTIINSYNSGDITYSLPLPTTFSLGGLCGHSSGSLTIENSWNNGGLNVAVKDGTSVTYSRLRIGGIIGLTEQTTTLNNVYNKGNIICDVKNNRKVYMINEYYYMNPYIGGLIGQNQGSNTTLYKCYNRGNITVTSSGTNETGYPQTDKVNVYAGGLVGDDYSNTSVCSLSYTYSVCNITAPTTNVTNCYVAGLIGNAKNSIINHSYYAGQLAGVTKGGIANGTLSSASLHYYLSTCGASAGNGAPEIESVMKATTFPTTLNGTGEQIFYMDTELINKGYPIFDIQASFTITWLDDNSYEIDHQLWAYGQTPTHADPTKPADAEYTYTFAGWTPTISAVTGDQTYTATYTAIPRDYTIQVKLQNDSIIADGAYPYGTILKVLAEPDYCYDFKQWSDGNTDNPRTITVTEDATYTAEFEKSHYTIKVETDNPSQGSASVSK